MKKIKYKFGGLAVQMPWSEDNLAIAEKEADGGDYSVEDDGIEEVSEPSQLDIIEAQVAYTAMMTDTLLEV